MNDHEIRDTYSGLARIEETKLSEFNYYQCAAGKMITVLKTKCAIF